MSLQVANITLYSLIIICELVGLCVSFFLFIVMLLRRSLIKTDRVSYLLISNSYIAFITASPLFIEMCITSIYGHLHPNISFDGWNCRVKSYVLYIHGCVYFYSFLLQGIYRFCRIVHPTRVVYQSFRPYAILSVAQWILAALMLLPSLFLGDLEYLPNDYHCQFGPTNLRGSMIGLSILFIIPFVSTLMFYSYTLYYVYTKTTVLTTISRNTTARRDLIILSRLVFLFYIYNHSGSSTCINSYHLYYLWFTCIVGISI